VHLTIVAMRRTFRCPHPQPRGHRGRVAGRNLSLVRDSAADCSAGHGGHYFVRRPNSLRRVIAPAHAASATAAPTPASPLPLPQLMPERMPPRASVPGAAARSETTRVEVFRDDYYLRNRHSLRRVVVPAGNMQELAPTPGQDSEIASTETAHTSGREAMGPVLQPREEAPACARPAALAAARRALEMRVTPREPLVKGSNLSSPPTHRYRLRLPKNNVEEYAKIPLGEAMVASGLASRASRSGIVKPSRRSRNRSLVLSRPQQQFALPVMNPSRPHASRNRRLDKRKLEHCLFFAKFGKCAQAESTEGCPFLHDPTAIGVCRRWLVGRCLQSSSDCVLSHAVDKDKMPVCERFLQGRCARADACPYLHVSHPRDAALCNAFALRGFCTRGVDCDKVHTWDCLEFLRKGTCDRIDQCRLRHWSPSRRDRAQNNPDFRVEESEVEDDVPMSGKGSLNSRRQPESSSDSDDCIRSTRRSEQHPSVQQKIERGRMDGFMPLTS
jgi:hypothetical protein